MPEITVTCDMCSGTGDATHGDRHTSTNMDRCRKCGGEGKIPACPGESRETSWPFAVPGAEIQDAPPSLIEGGKIDHEFKSHPDVFWPAARGEKTFEFRKDDRGGYHVGQTVRLRCYDPARGYLPVPALDRRITNILRPGEFGLQDGYCILSLAPIAVGEALPPPPQTEIQVAREAERILTTVNRSGCLPDCMMPDGAEPCKAFQEQDEAIRAALAVLQSPSRQEDRSRSEDGRDPSGQAAQQSSDGLGPSGEHPSRTYRSAPRDEYEFWRCPDCHCHSRTQISGTAYLFRCINCKELFIDTSAASARDQRASREDGVSQPRPEAAPRLTLTALHAANIARQAEWCPDQVPDLSFRGNELAGEVGEACNVIKKLERERQGWRGSRATLDDLAQELADVVICADLCAITAGIDLDAAVVAKFNATSEKQGLSTMLPRPEAASPVDDANSGGEAPSGWQPIGTAPKNADDIFVSVSRIDEQGSVYRFVTVSSYEDQPYRRGFRHRNGAWGATHWQPVPVPVVVDMDPETSRPLSASPPPSQEKSGGRDA